MDGSRMVWVNPVHWWGASGALVGCASFTSAPGALVRSVHALSRISLSNRRA